MKIIKAISSVILMLVLVCVPLFSLCASCAGTVCVNVGDGTYTSDASGDGWTLAKATDSYTLTISSLHDSLLYKDGYISAFNCTLNIVITGENALSAGYAEMKAPYDLFAIYAENAVVNISGNGSLTINTAEATEAVPFYFVNSTLTLNGAAITVEANKHNFVFKNSDFNVNGGKLSVKSNTTSPIYFEKTAGSPTGYFEFTSTNPMRASFPQDSCLAESVSIYASAEDGCVAEKDKFILPDGLIVVADSAERDDGFTVTVKVTPDNITIGDDGTVTADVCVHIDVDPEDGYCDRCGLLIDESKLPETTEPEDENSESGKTCPLCSVYEKYKDTFFVNFFIIFLHRLVHALFV